MITRRFAVPLFFVLCAVIFLLDAYTDDSSRWAVYTCNVLAEASETISNSDDIETGKEGFVITGRETSAVSSWNGP